MGFYWGFAKSTYENGCKRMGQNGRVLDADLVLKEFGIDLSRVVPKRLSWMSRGRLAHGKMTDLSGDGGQGKTMMLLDWCARYSRGEPLPDGEPDAKQHAIYMSLEDDVDDTLVPRLMIAGADLTNIRVVNKHPSTGKRVSFPEDVDLLVQAVTAWNTGLIVIDSMMSFMSPGKKVNDGEDIRYCYDPLVDAIKEPGVGIIAVRHITKGGGTSAQHRGAGSAQISNVARAGLTVARSQKNPHHRVLAQNKENLSEKMPSLIFELESVLGEDHPRVNWLGVSDEDADELMMDPRERQELHDAREWLRESLAEGRVAGHDIKNASKQAMIQETSLRRAAKDLRVEYNREGFGPGSKMWWSLPKPAFGLSVVTGSEFPEF
jgi:putative DNA primase/helicase